MTARTGREGLYRTPTTARAVNSSRQHTPARPPEETIRRRDGDGASPRWRFARRSPAETSAHPLVSPSRYAWFQHLRPLADLRQLPQHAPAPGGHSCLE